MSTPINGGKIWTPEPEETYPTPKNEPWVGKYILYLIGGLTILAAPALVPLITQITQTP